MRQNLPEFGRKVGFQNVLKLSEFLTIGFPSSLCHHFDSELESGYRSGRITQNLFVYDILFTNIKGLESDEL